MSNQMNNADGAIATLLRTAINQRLDGNTKAYHRTLNTIRLAIEANSPKPEQIPLEDTK